MRSCECGVRMEDRLTIDAGGLEVVFVQHLRAIVAEFPGADHLVLGCGRERWLHLPQGVHNCPEFREAIKRAVERASSDE